jgi:hypothetical protein
MGHCSSVFENTGVFINDEIIEQCAKLRADPELRKSFATYIKSGEWMDKVLEQVPKVQRTVTHEERLAYERENVLFEYRTADGKLKVFENIGTGNIVRTSWSAKQALNLLGQGSVSGDNSGSRPGSNSERRSGHGSASGSGSNTPAHGRDKKTEEELKIFSESYFNIESNACMEFEELLTILIYTLVPLYMASRQCLQLKDTLMVPRLDRESSTLTLNSGASFDPDKVPTKVSERAVNIFHGCAAYFDEASILEELESDTWLHNVQKLLLNHALGITVVDVSDASLPIVFCNHQYASMVGASDRGSVEGNSMRAFYSSDAAMNVHATSTTATATATATNATATQVGELEAALRSGKVEKFAIAQQTQDGGQAFLDLVTVLSGRTPVGTTINSGAATRMNSVIHTATTADAPKASCNSKFAAIVHVLGNKDTKSNSLKVLTLYFH